MKRRKSKRPKPRKPVRPEGLAAVKSSALVKQSLGSPGASESALGVDAMDDSPEASGPARVGPDQVVHLSYSVFDEEGEKVDSSPEGAPVGILFGYGQLLPALESALEGAGPGECRTVELECGDAYGERDPGAVLSLAREELPADIEPGDQFEADHEGGGVVVLTVLNVSSDSVEVDANHPLAGQRVRFEVRVDGIRPATDSELDLAAERLENQLSQGQEEPEEPGLALIPSRRLLERPSRR